MKSPRVKSLQSAIRNPQSAIIVLFIAMLAASWQRWTQPLIDHGREMNLPARILASERVYSDVQVLYGPFAPHFNALLYRVFGIHLSVLKAAGAVCAILILMMIYRLARALMSEWESFLVASLALVACALKSTANYIQPYAYAALYGLVFALGSLVATVSYVKRRSNTRSGLRLQAESLRNLTPEGGAPNLILAGSLAGLALISKPEIALAGLAAGFAALIVESLTERKPLWRGAALFSAPVVIIAAVTYSAILSRAPLRVLLEDNHVLFTAMPSQLIYFNRRVSGLAQWPSSLLFSLAGIGTFALWVGMCGVIGAIASRKQAEWRGVLKVGLILVCAGALWHEASIRFSGASSNVTPFASAVFILPALIGLIIRDCWREMKRRGDGATWRQGEEAINGQGNKGMGLFLAPSPRRPVAQSLSIRILLVIAVFSFVAILRVIMNVATTGAYAPFYLPALTVVYPYMLFRVAPA